MAVESRKGAQQKISEHLVIGDVHAHGVAYRAFRRAQDGAPALCGAPLTRSIPMSKENLVVRIEPELLDRIDTQCAELDVSRSLLIREILFLMFAPADEIRKRIENR